MVQRTVGDGTHGERSSCAQSGPLAEIDDWKAFLSSQPDGIEELRLHTRTGRPLGGESFVNLAEVLTGRFLRKRKPGPKHRR